MSSLFDTGLFKSHSRINLIANKPTSLIFYVSPFTNFQWKSAPINKSISLLEESPLSAKFKDCKHGFCLIATSIYLPPTSKQIFGKVKQQP